MSELFALPRAPRRGDLVEVTIDHLDRSGRGVASFEALIGPDRSARRWRVLARKALPGERVHVEVERNKRGVIEGGTRAYLETSSQRVIPRCPHFGLRTEPNKGCGGCTIQSLAPAAQRLHKRALVADLLAGAGLSIDLDPIVASPDEWYYRGKMEFSFGDNPESALALGLHPTGYKHDVLALQTCFLQSPESAAIVRAVAAWAEGEGLSAYKPRRQTGFLRALTIREAKRTGQRLLELVTTSAPEAERLDGTRVGAAEIARSFAALVARMPASIGCGADSVYWTEHHAKRGERTRMIEHLLAGAPTIEEELRLPDRTLRFSIHPRSFFQPNPLGAELLYAHVVSEIGACAGGAALDLYCGTGTIGCALATRAERVLGVELRPEAVAAANETAARHGLMNARFFAGDVGKVLESDSFQTELGEGVVAVVVDPPRSGLAPAALSELARIGAPRIVYVSCNPAALARDLSWLTCEAGYAIERLRPFDLFPHTAHIECVATLTRKVRDDTDH